MYNEKSQKFRTMLNSNNLDFLMEAHDGISARIVQNAGFKAIWASGLCMSTALGVRDRNELSCTQVTQILEQMSEVTDIPILADGDTGYGDFNNVRILVKKLCRAQIAALAIEDKIFPKTNSFIDKNQELAGVNEFCGKIKAAKDSQIDPNFCLIARTESLITGASMSEALERANAYCEAGADGIIIHSKKTNASEILEFSRQWNRKSPLIIIPTKYYTEPTKSYENSKISLVIWANHNMRARIRSMQDVCRSIMLNKSVKEVENNITPVSEIFTLLDYNELARAESIYQIG